MSASTPAPVHLPLEDFCVLRSQDAQQASAYMGRCFSPHTLHVHSPDEGLDIRLHAVDLGAVTIHVLRYGARVTIDPGERGDFYMLQLPLSGQAHVRSGASQVLLSPSVLGILRPQAPTVMQWSADCSMVLLSVSRLKMHEQLGLNSHSVSAFAQMSATRQDPAVGAWWQALEDWLMNLDAHADYWLADPQAQKTLQDWLLQGFAQLLGFCNGQAHHQRHLTQGQRALQRAKALVAQNLDQALTVQAIAAHAGTGVRELEKLFERHEGMSPSAYARQQRLQSAHEMLQSQPHLSVTQVALSYGFAHTGRFALLYRQAYGCSPSQTRLRPRP